MRAHEGYDRKRGFEAVLLTTGDDPVRHAQRRAKPAPAIQFRLQVCLKSWRSDVGAGASGLFPWRYLIFKVQGYKTCKSLILLAVLAVCGERVSVTGYFRGFRA